MLKKTFNNSSSAWRTIGDHTKYFRSMWEANFARYLEFQKTNNLIKSWEHEPQIFWFDGIRKGTTNYTPDFKVTQIDDTIIWYEVKGYYDAKSLTKIKRFRKYYPQEKLFLIDSKWFQKNNSKLRLLIPDWERKKTIFNLENIS